MKIYKPLTTVFNSKQLAKNYKIGKVIAARTKDEVLNNAYLNLKLAHFEYANVMQEIELVAKSAVPFQNMILKQMMMRDKMIQMKKLNGKDHVFWGYFFRS